MFNYSSAIARCNDNAIRINLKKIEAYKEYSYLYSATGMEYAKFLEMFPDAPAAIKTWYKFANGGLLFDTLLLSTRTFIPELSSPFVSLSTYNCSTARLLSALPDNLAVFAVASFGDLYCFDLHGSSEVFQWSTTEHRVAARWPSFSLWLHQELTGAIELITEGILFPIAAQEHGD